MLENSIIIAAHPDDEILWFSSILDKVDAVVLSYLAIESKPQHTIGRKKCLSEHPIKNLSCLGIDESEFKSANWRNPLPSSYGLETSKRNIFRNRSFLKRYIKNYHKLKEELESKLAGFSNVFTHNPWGEYGNAEHIQVYRVVKELQQGMKFDLWFSNYCGPVSIKLMSKHISTLNIEYVTLKTDKALLQKIKSLYIKHGCWTWYDDWAGFDAEAFIKDTPQEAKPKAGADALSLNYIKVTK
jgi:hypothetical protein